MISEAAVEDEAAVERGSCEAPIVDMTIEQAHAAMQTHLACPTADCPRRQAALAVLVNAGRYVLA